MQSHPKCIEAKTILGTLYAHEVLSAIPRTGFAASKEDVTPLHRRAITLLESVRATWKPDSKKTDPTREALLLTLARLYENDAPEKALLCLQNVEAIYADLADTDEETMVPLQLLNNMATFYWHAEKYDLARELYQTALNSIPELVEKDETADTDALATTLTYNLARTEEAAGNLEEATKHYEQLLTRHDDYVDANMRLTYMALRRGGDEGPKRISRLMGTDGNNLEVRALYGWYLGKQKRKTAINIAEDPEQRHYKHSLQHHDKHDRYSLTGMGNLYLLTAREMRRDTEVDKEKRRKTYEKAVEFFDKALQLDPKNAYAAQGVAIAMVEDRRDLKSAVQVFTKVKETLGGAHAVVNLGHCLAGLEQWARAIENVSFPISKSFFGISWGVPWSGRVSICHFWERWFLNTETYPCPSFLPSFLTVVVTHCRGTPHSPALYPIAYTPTLVIYLYPHPRHAAHAKRHSPPPMSPITPRVCFSSRFVSSLFLKKSLELTMI